MRKNTVFFAGISAVFFIGPILFAIGSVIRLRGFTDILPVVALVATISMLSSGFLAKASAPASAMRRISMLLCIDLALLAFATMLVTVGDKSFLSDPVSLTESAWIALLMALAPIFTALAFSLPGRRSPIAHIVMVISFLVSAFTIFSAIMIFRDLIQASTIHAMLLLLWAYCIAGMPIVGICAISLALWYGRSAGQ